MNQFAKETIPISLEDEMKRSYLDYAMSVIVGRALPDVRDGLKPVHRRVLFAMHELSNDFNKPYKKSARIVGDVIGKYHPHGDTAVYDTIVRMAQDFSLRYMLVDGQGNFGSVDGDNAAAMRYTEIRMSKIAHELLEDIDKETVNFGPNYDGSEQEPLIMPARIPNLLINGSSGIAVGMATNIPPHNLNEVVDACLLLLEKPESSIDALIKLIPAPDFPTAGIIHGTSGVKEGYRTGRGRVVMRGRTHVEKLDKGNREALIVDELPYQVNKKTFIEKIAELVNDKKIEGISDLRDESDKSGKPELPQAEPEPTAEEIEMKRKEAIADKRRQSLILARSKITPKNVIRKDAIDKVNKKDMEIEVAKREADEIKRKAHEYAETTKKKAEEDIKGMQSLVKTKIISDAEPKKKRK